MPLSFFAHAHADYCSHNHLVQRAPFQPGRFLYGRIMKHHSTLFLALLDEPTFQRTRRMFIHQSQDRIVIQLQHSTLLLRNRRLELA